MMTPADQIATRLEDANRAYRRGQPIMPDSTYDALEAQLRKLAPTHPVLARVGAPGEDGWPSVKHPIPMGSLEKVQTEEEFAEWYVSRVARGVKLLITDKLDGMSLVLTYEDGELVRAATRGDGVEGEDITRNALIIQGVLPRILYTGTCYVRGEVIVTKTDFAEHFKGESNPRNTATGTSKRQSEWRKAQHLTFVAYNIVAANHDHQAHSRYAELEKLVEWGFIVPTFFQAEAVETIVAYRQEYISFRREQLDWTIDGLVVEIDDSDLRRAAGEHNMRPKGAIAFKFPHESAETTLRDIRWQVGNSGRITPVAIFDEVELAGAKISRASLHNARRVEQLKLYRGCTVLVSRRNDVIPMIEANLSLGITVDDFE